MTTVAWDGKVMAADTQTSLFRGSFTKIFKLSDGSLLGASGGISDVCAAREWFLLGGEKPKLETDFHAMVVTTSGEVFIYESPLVKMPCTSKNFMAIGSGRDFAMAAMHLGQPASEAVRIASIFDPMTNQVVDALWLADPWPKAVSTLNA